MCGFVVCGFIVVVVVVVVVVGAGVVVGGRVVLGGAGVATDGHLIKDIIFEHKKGMIFVFIFDVQLSLARLKILGLPTSLLTLLD